MPQRARVQAGRGERHSLFPDQRGLRRRQGRRCGGRGHDRLQGSTPRDPDRPGDGQAQYIHRRGPCGWDVLGIAAHEIRRVLRVPVHGRRRTGATCAFTRHGPDTHRRGMDLPANARVSDRRRGVRTLRAAARQGRDAHWPSAAISISASRSSASSWATR